MRQTLAALGLMLAAALPSQAATHIGISIGIQAPGQYGRIDINNYPQPTLVMPHPVVIAPSPVAVVRQPIYLYVPPGQQADWSRYCGHYRACGQPVYFVRDDWVREQYTREHGPRWKQQGRHDNGRGHGQGRGHDRD